MSILAFTPHKTGRKKLAQLLADHLGVKATYLGTPSFAYQIGDATLDRDWTLYLPDGIEAQAVLESAHKAGFATTDPGEVALTVTMPTPGWSERTRANLEALLAAKGPLIARALGIPATPVEFTDDTVAFPWFASMPGDDTRDAAITLLAAICQRAQEATRISSKPSAPGNDKYTMRCFLLSLGFIGPEHKQARRILLADLEGNAAWRTPTSRKED
ncbi:hypothetical protein BSR28_08725 [Boudabousia liubingyangii]|uniref:hypothetical protein n=1 Tax=Boudabousia liubingyangii TaxID=1921764 RepID=UPI0009399851|nr:hypothetical protein [Boudabousia liubingyangii]OKL45945.1 hypothetical protein BSR28_08725 [Boudabousia liubingyangii]CAB0518398.1 hypothetical protein CIP100161_01655 [Corynebacterium diphtheriae]